MLASQCNNVHGISREKDLIISFNMFKIFPWKLINIIYLKDNSILEKLDNWIYFQILRKSCTRSSCWEKSSSSRYICCIEKERNALI